MCEPDTQEVIPKGATSLLDWMKAPLRSIYLGKGDFLTLPVKTKWNIPDEAADSPCSKQATGDSFYDDQDIHLLNMPITLAMVSAVVRGPPLHTGISYNLIAAEPKNS